MFAVLIRKTFDSSDARIRAFTSGVVTRAGLGTQRHLNAKRIQDLNAKRIQDLQTIE